MEKRLWKVLWDWLQQIFFFGLISKCSFYRRRHRKYHKVVFLSWMIWKPLNSGAIANVVNVPRNPMEWPIVDSFIFWFSVMFYHFLYQILWMLKIRSCTLFFVFDWNFIRRVLTNKHIWSDASARNDGGRFQVHQSSAPLPVIDIRNCWHRVASDGFIALLVSVPFISLFAGRPLVENTWRNIYIYMYTCIFDTWWCMYIVHI